MRGVFFKLDEKRIHRSSLLLLPRPPPWLRLFLFPSACTSLLPGAPSFFPRTLHPSPWPPARHPPSITSCVNPPLPAHPPPHTPLTRPSSDNYYKPGKDQLACKKLNKGKCTAADIHCLATVEFEKKLRYSREKNTFTIPWLLIFFFYLEEPHILYYDISFI